MYRSVLAFDNDGTLVDNGAIPPALQKALEHSHTLGYALFMVTGQQIGKAELGPLESVFAGIRGSQATGRSDGGRGASVAVPQVGG